MEGIRLSPRTFVPGLTTLVMLVVGLLLFRDYGMSWDEQLTRQNGLVTARYVLQLTAPQAITGELAETPDLAAWPDRDYGVGFELPAFIGEKLLGLEASKSIYEYRHLLTYLVFLIGVMATYGMAVQRHGTWGAGLFAAALLCLSPRFFAEGFYNDKDIVFMSAFALAGFTMFNLYRKPDAKRVLLHALATAWALDIRVMAILIIPATLFVLGVKAVQEKTMTRLAILFAAWLALTFAAHVITTPFLWADPFGNFIAVIRNMAHFRWHGVELYFGQYIDGTQPPWHYAPVWIAITTPLLILLLFLVGLFRIRNTEDLVVAGLALAPAVAVTILHSVQYDGWRHIYFLYPFMILTAVNAAMAIWNVVQRHRWARLAALAIAATHFIFIGTWMARAHPYQNVYFNALAGSHRETLFEMDYWGLSNRAALEYILAHDDAPLITVAPASLTPLEKSFLMLSEDQKRRLILVRDTSFATYVITNYKWVQSRDDAPFLQTRDVFHRIDVDGAHLLSVFRKKPESP